MTNLKHNLNGWSTNWSQLAEKFYDDHANYYCSDEEIDDLAKLLEYTYIRGKVSDIPRGIYCYEEGDTSTTVLLPSVKLCPCKECGIKTDELDEFNKNDV